MYRENLGAAGVVDRGRAHRRREWLRALGERSLSSYRSSCNKRARDQTYCTAAVTGGWFTTVTVIDDGYCFEWCTTLCATTGLVSS